MRRLLFLFLGRKSGHALLAMALLISVALVSPASALVVDPFFAGSVTTTTSVCCVDPGFTFEGYVSHFDIDAAHGIVDDGGVLLGSIVPGNWKAFDFDVWAPLWNNLNLAAGGEITYGNPAPGLFAVSFVNVVNSDDPAIINTYQVVFVGNSGFQTNTGLAISPGSVIFAYGSPSNPNGTVNLSSSTPAAIGLWSLATNTPLLTTLLAHGIGNSNGIVTTADVAALQNSGDPFLFNWGSSGYEAPVAFTSLVPEPATVWLLGFSLAALALFRAKRI
jgi:hypothetical protein